MSRRTERVASLIRQIIASAIQSRLSDPRVERLTSVTGVEVSPDLSVAKIRVSVLAPASRRKLTLEALRSASRRLRTMVGQELAVRQVPELIFYLDESIQHGIETERAIDEALASSGLRSSWDAPADEVESAGDDADNADSDRDGPETQEVPR